MRCLALGLMALLFCTQPALAQSLTLAAPDELNFSTRTLQLLAIITLLSLVPGLAVMVTCFPFLLTVLSILRQAIGLQTAPPNMVIVTLALFLTWYIMDPVLTQAWQEGLEPLSTGQLDFAAALPRMIAPFQTFMSARVAPDTLDTLMSLRPETQDLVTPPLSVLVPAFLLSEIERAFQIGFVLFMPFLIIDMVVASILMAMGMMMVPPVLISLPFKLAFFVVADGWTLVSAALVRSYL